MRKIFNKKYTFIEQYDVSDCGVVCIATIARYYKLRISIARLREISGTDKNGNNALSLIYTLNKLGFSSEGLKITEEEFFKFNNLPAIFHVIKDKELLHYVVVYSISNKEVILSDPSKGIMKITPKEFFHIWSNVVITATPNDNFQEGDLTQNFFKKFFILLKSQKKLLFKIFLASIVYTAIGIIGAYFYRILVDIILPEGKLEILTYLSLGFIALNLLKLILNIYRTRILLYLSQNIDIELVLSYYCHVLYLPMNFFETRKTGEIISRFKDAFLVRDAISGATLSLMIDIIMVVGGAVLLINQNITLFLVTLSTVILYSFIVYGFLKPFEKMNRDQMEQGSKLTSNLVESVGGIETIKSTNTQDIFLEDIRSKLKKLMKIVFKISNYRVIQTSLISFIKVTGTILILWMGAYYIINGKMTVGELFTFNALVIYFLDPVSNLINLQPKIQTAIVAADRLGEVMELELEKLLPDSSTDFKGNIVIKNVSFKYGMRKNVLKDINMEINRGSKIALVGESGSGKTTLAKLILAFYYPNKGYIKINNKCTNEISYKDIRNKIAYVSQNIFLFSKSIKDNLYLGNDVSESEYKKVLKITKCDEFINKLYLKDKTIMAENGATLSGGQRQRIAIARAILHKPEILVLDEATSNLDINTEKVIINAVFNELRDITTIIIAHRLSTILNCDRIFLLENGKIIEEGTHNQLLMKTGKYHNIWKNLEENRKSI